MTQSPRHLSMHPASPMKSQNLDLNLLLVFHAIYHERSVSAAAKKLELSQPALSAALRKLRDHMGDPLFVRSGNGMVPTRMADRLSGPIGQALTIIQHNVNSERSFDPRTATRTFRIMINDFLRQMLMAPLLHYAECHAPGVVLDFLPQAESPAEFYRALREEMIDIGMQPMGNLDDDVSYKAVNTDDFVFAVRAGHPALSRPVTDDVIRDFRWIVNSSTPAISAIVEKAFLDAGIVRKIGAILPDTVTVPVAVAGTNMITVIGRGNFIMAKKQYGLTIIDLPVEIPRLTGALVWAKNSDDDQGLRWLRGRIEEILQSAVLPNMPL